MRIGIITGEYPPMRGGVGDYTYTLIGEWLRMGHTVHLLTRPQAQDTRDGVTLHNIMTHWGIGALPIIRRWAQEQHLDVLNLQYQTAIYDMSGWMHFLPRIVATPVVTTFHDLLVPYLFPKAGALRPWIVRTLARSSARAITTNHEDYARLHDLPHAQMIPIGSNIALSAATAQNRVHIRAAYALPDETTLLAHFGFLYPNRGVEVLLQAVHQLRTEGANVRLLIIGGREGGPVQPAYVAQLDAQIAALELGDYVVWTGFVEAGRVSELLNAADILVLPYLDGASYRRGSLIAGVQHGCAIVTTQPQVTITEWRDGMNMSFVPAADAATLAGAIAHLIAEPQQAQRYRDALRISRHTFDWQQIAQAFITQFAAVQRG